MPGEAGASPGSRRDAGGSRRMLSGKDAQQSRGQAEHPAAGRPPSLIIPESLRIAFI